MLRVVKNVTWQKRIINEVLSVGLPRVSTTIRERRLRFSGHCWKSKNEVVSDLVLWEPKHGIRNVGGQAHTLILLICWRRTPGSPGCLSAVMDDMVGWRKRAMRWGEGVGWGGWVDWGRPSSSQALTLNPQGKRKRGSSRNTWHRDAEVEMQGLFVSWLLNVPATG